MRSALVAVCTSAVAALSCRASVIRHDQEAAARAATEFATVAFVRGEVDESYSMLSERTKRTLSLMDYGRSISAMHPRARPSTLVASEYERVPGEPMTYVFLDGQNGSEQFFYRLVMEGSAGAGYRVSGLFRGSGPYPPSKLRAKLEGTQSAWR